MEQFKIEAQPRTGRGKAESRRLREAGKVLAVVYGDKKEPVSLVLEHNELMKQLEHEAFYSHILTLDVGGSSQQVVLRDMQRHPHKPQVLHIDFQRVSASQKLHMQVPLHFIDEEKCPAIKLHGGAISHLLADVEITCLPKDLPEYIEVDMGEADIGYTVHLSDLKLPEGVEILALMHGSEADQAVVTVHEARSAEAEIEAEAEAEAEVAGEVPTSEAAEPESEEG